MTSVIITFLTAVGGVLAGAIPNLLVSEKRRLLRLLAEEAATLDVVIDSNVRRHLLMAQESTAIQYRTLAKLTRADRLKWQRLLAYGFLYPLAAVAAGIGVYPPGFGFEGPTEQPARYVGWGVVVLCGLVFTLFSRRVTDAKSHESEVSDAVREERERADEAETVLQLVAGDYRRRISNGEAAGDDPVQEALPIDAPSSAQKRADVEQPAQATETAVDAQRDDEPISAETWRVLKDAVDHIENRRAEEAEAARTTKARRAVDRVTNGGDPPIGEERRRQLGLPPSRAFRARPEGRALQMLRDSGQIDLGEANLRDEASQALRHAADNEDPLARLKRDNDETYERLSKALRRRSGDDVDDNGY